MIKNCISFRLFLVMQYYDELVVPQCPMQAGCTCQIFNIQDGFMARPVVLPLCPSLDCTILSVKFYVFSNIIPLLVTDTGQNMTFLCVRTHFTVLLLIPGSPFSMTLVSWHSQTLVPTRYCYVWCLLLSQLLTITIFIATTR